MTDIVERLKTELGWGIGPALLCQEAADEIERLREQLKIDDRMWHEVEEQNGWLRAALAHVLIPLGRDGHIPRADARRRYEGMVKEPS